MKRSGKDKYLFSISSKTKVKCLEFIIRNGLIDADPLYLVIEWQEYNIQIRQRSGNRSPKHGFVADLLSQDSFTDCRS